MVRAMQRPLTISMAADLPHRAHSLDDAAIAKIFGGWCGREHDSCSVTEPCCYEQRNNTGSGMFILKCIGFTSGTNRICDFVPYP